MRSPEERPPADLDLADPSLETKIAQLLLVGFRGVDEASAARTIDDIGEHGLGGVVLFDVDGPGGQGHLRNIVSLEQVSALTRALQAAVPLTAAAVSPPADHSSCLPLFVAVDQEGGQVRRLKEIHGFPPSPSARQLGQRDDLDATHEQAATTARLLASCGVNVNLAPVVDLDINPTNPIIGMRERSYSSDPRVVSAHAAAFVEAHHDEGICCALKHFPGHGSSNADTHTGFTDVTETWQEVELAPFERLIKEDPIPAVMTAHVFNARLDEQWPATLSHATITGLLRRKLGFDGVVFSDDLGMGAIAVHYGRQEALKLALQAGVDVLCLCNQTTYEEDLVERTIEEVSSLVASGAITESRIDEACARVLRLKSSLRPCRE